eukprot:tig00020556_g11059.t1
MEAAVCHGGFDLGLDLSDPFLAHSPALRLELAGEAAGSFLPGACGDEAGAGPEGGDGHELGALALGSPMLSPSAFFLDADEEPAHGHPLPSPADEPAGPFPFDFSAHPAPAAAREEAAGRRPCDIEVPLGLPAALSGPFSPASDPSPVPSPLASDAASPAAPPGYVFVRVPIAQLRGQLGDLDRANSCGAVLGTLAGLRIPRSESVHSLPGRLCDVAASPRAGPASGASTPGRQASTPVPGKRSLPDADLDFEAAASPAKRRGSSDGRRGGGALALSGSVNAAYLERLQREGCDGKILPPWLCKPRAASAPPRPARRRRRRRGCARARAPGSGRGADGRGAGPLDGPRGQAQCLDAGAACNFVTFYGEGGALRTLALPDCFGPGAAPAQAVGLQSPDSSGFSLELPPAFARPAPPGATVAGTAAASPRGGPAPLPFESDEPLLRKVAAEQRARLRARLEAERAAAAAAAARLQTSPVAEGEEAAIARLAAAHPRDSLVALFDLPMAARARPARPLRARGLTPAQDAAKRLGIAPAVVKQVCRAHGITRWPQRKLRSLARWAEQAEIVLANRVPGFDHAAIAAAATRLRAARSLLYRDPSASIKEATAAMRRLLVGPIQQRLSAAAAAGPAAAASGPFAAAKGVGGGEESGEEGSGAGRGGGAGVQVEDVNVFLHCYLAASAEARLRAKAAPEPAPAPAPPAPLELPTVDISLPEGGHCLSPLLVDGALFPGL